MLEAELLENIEQIELEINDACVNGKRERNDVTLICVSKFVDNQTTQQVVEAGITHLAENRMEKLLEKKEYLKDYDNITWHFIGNLQRRKVKTVINEIDYFHALDNEKLAAEIQKRAESVKKCFVQVNVSGEESKQGLSPEETLPFIKSLEAYDNIMVVGLMTMAPIEADEAELHQIFSRLKKLQESIANEKLSHAPCLEISMGMSQDFSIAIEEGATFIRVGSRIFK